MASMAQETWSSGGAPDEPYNDLSFLQASQVLPLEPASGEAEHSHLDGTNIHEGPTGLIRTPIIWPRKDGGGCFPSPFPLPDPIPFPHPDPISPIRPDPNEHGTDLRQLHSDHTQLIAKVEQLKAAVDQQAQRVASQLAQELQSRAHQILQEEQRNGESHRSDHEELRQEHAGLTAEVEKLRAVVTEQMQDLRTETGAMRSQVGQVLQILKLATRDGRPGTWSNFPASSLNICFLIFAMTVTTFLVFKM